MVLIGRDDMVEGSPLAGWHGRFFHSENMVTDFPLRHQLPGVATS